MPWLVGILEGVVAINRVLLVMVVMAAGMWAAANWKQAPFPNWSEDVVLELLTDSPWAKPRTVPIAWSKREEKPFSYKDVPGADPTRKIESGSPVGGIGAPKPKLPDRADLIVRWASALPVRQATALYRQRDENLDAAKRNELIGTPPADYIVELFGVPTMVAHKGAESVEAVLLLSSVLRTKDGRLLKPSKVSVRAMGLSLDIRIHFPRTTPLRLSDKEVEFSADLQVFPVKEKFKLSEMQYLGSLEL